MNKGLKMKVIGIGGSGCNAVSRMAKEQINNLELVAANTDAQSLKQCLVKKRILIGQRETNGLGSGMNIKAGEKAALESYERLKKEMEGLNILFLTCGLGGGTGTSGVSVLADIAKELKILTIAVVTLPFSFEGSVRYNIAKAGLSKLSEKADTVLIVPNDKLLSLSSERLTIENAFWICDGILREAVRGIGDLISLPGIINVDFADLKSILEKGGKAFLGIGKASGDKRAFSAANMALHSPLLDFSIKDAGGILLNIASKNDLTLSEVNIAATFIKKAAGENTKMVFGVSDDSSLKEGELKITLIATSKQ